MFIKRLELTGFKSFPDPTEVLLHNGVTAVVGPNGCGKSNLLDALRWVLGEQRVRLLRGAKMEEIIFAGTRERPPVNVAEVQLVIDNRSGVLPTEFTEVAIARRLYRSGESEYLINRNACRLKDIQDMLMDTGMGSHAYSVIQQGMVDAIISEKNEDRRHLFEEAAGVAKYKHRKQAALRKLDSTEQDLLRLNDVAGELGRRVRSLARQKGSASRHIKLTDKLRELEIQQGAREFARIKKQFDTVTETLRVAEAEAARSTGAVNELQLNWEKARLESDQAEKAQNEAADELATATQQLHEAQQEELKLTERIAHNNELVERGGERREQLSERLTNSRGRLEEAGAQSARSKRERDEQREKLADLERRHRAATEAAQAARARARAAEESFREKERVVDRVKSDAEADRRIADDLSTRLAAAREGGQAVDRQLAEIEHQRTRIGQDLERLEANDAELKNRLTELDGSRETIQVALKAREDERQTLSETLTGLTEKRALLDGMVRRGEGLGKAAEALVAEYGDRGLIGWIDEISPDPEWCLAVEAALGERLGLLWSPDVTAIDGALYRLRGDDIGRAAMLVPTMRADRNGDRPALDDDGFTGWLDEKVHAEGAAAEWIAPLLGTVATTRDDDSARRIFDRLERCYTVVTAQGTLYAPPGIVMTGTETGESLVGRADRLAEFDAEIAAVRDKREQCEQALANARDETAALEAERVAAEQELETVRERRTEARLARERLDTRRQETTERRDESTTLIAALEMDHAACLERLSAREQEQTEFGFERGRLKSDRTSVEEEANRREEEARRLGAELNDARVRQVEIAAQHDAAVADGERLTELVADTQSEIAASLQRTNELAEELTRLGESSVATRERVAERDAERAARDGVRTEARTVAAAAREAYAAIDNEIREARRVRDAAVEEENTRRIERTRSESSLAEIRTRLREKHDIDPATVTVDDDALPVEELTGQLDDTRRRLDRIGPVNVLAVEEYEREKERLDFIEKQVADLRAAKKSLLDTIGELNETAGRRFMETFEEARRNFQNVFGELFRGGEADVRLADPEQPLDSPIEIFARPRGKKFIGLRQLSGGERALTALAMLFGLYLVKPSPFCILDEVDAPLDDANCGRFLRLIDKFKSRTQFVIITHNKMTMEAADTLYGVTMERPGISQLVSVRLNRAPEEEAETAGEAAPLAEPRIELAAENGGDSAEEPEFDHPAPPAAAPVVNRVEDLIDKIDIEPNVPVLPENVPEGDNV